MKGIKMLALSALLLLGNGLAAGMDHSKKAEASEGKVAELRAAVRDLWVGHIFWMRNAAIFEAAKNKKAQGVADKKAVENARAIADAVGGFYGKEAGDALFKLLAGHYGAVREHMKATLKKDKKGQAKAVKTAMGNAEEIATFLSGANPNLPKKILKEALEAHGAHHVGQNEAIQSADWAREADIWDAMRGHMLNVADILADGIAQQFPDKFVEAED